MTWLNEFRDREQRLMAVAPERYLGKYRGVVVANTDPLQLGRLTLCVPAVTGEAITGWAMPCVPFGGGQGFGMLALPEPNDTVWVEFEGGEQEFPIWVGTFWRRPDGQSHVPTPLDIEGAPTNPYTADQNAAEYPPKRVVLSTRGGHVLQMLNEPGAEDEDLVMLEARVDEAVRNVLLLGRNNLKLFRTEGTKPESGDGPAETIALGRDEIKLDLTFGDQKSVHLRLTRSGVEFQDADANKVSLLDGKVMIEAKSVTIVATDRDGDGITITGPKIAMIQ